MSKYQFPYLKIDAKKTDAINTGVIRWVTCIRIFWKSNIFEAAPARVDDPVDTPLAPAKATPFMPGIWYNQAQS